VQITELGSTGDGRDLYRAFREEAQRDPGVRRMATSTFAFFGGGMQVPLALGDTAQVTSTVVPVDTSFLDMMDIALLEGRGFDAERTDRSAVVVNEAFVQAMGWSSAVGRSVDLSESSMVGRALGTIDIIGVAENVHTRSMRQRIQPVMWISNAVFGGGVGAIYAQIQPGRVGATLDALQQAWTAVAPNRPFQYNFLDAVVDEAYQAERRWQSIVQYAAGFALLIACFGLFGLAALAVAQRTKEVGIRKVLGASVASILLLFSTDFLKLTAGAVALAAPVAYWGAQQWLQSFAYRVDLGPAIFLVAGGIVAAVALATVGVHAVQAARLDPVQNLRDE
jgi:putative ABC transport system permease protein